MRGQRFAFVLRVWEDAAGGPAGTSALRGSLQQADSGETHYFTSVDDIPALLKRLTGRPDAPRSNEPSQEDSR